jgi:hypothetical protein
MRLDVVYPCCCSINVRVERITEDLYLYACGACRIVFTVHKGVPDRSSEVDVDALLWLADQLRSRQAGS